MPLHKGSSKKVISRNIEEMQEAGHPHNQAVAAALHNADKGFYGHMKPPTIKHPTEYHTKPNGNDNY